ncbi:MAG: site-specific DNA-methyltransferase [Chlorobi bacterium]|nr:MAG: site-specific DNA-methyltransferase [Bacteroidota bacterium]MBL1161258.1 site-specific DNA-methyltransferase [Chlorobiota bacterium]
MAKNDIESIRHKDKRAHIPSKEEAGYEDANEKVNSGKKVLELPKNPVVHRGQDPELFWLNKYGNDDRDDLLRVDIRSLYRHEHIAPEKLISSLYAVASSQYSVGSSQYSVGSSQYSVGSSQYSVGSSQSKQLDLFSSVNELFGNALDKDELEKVSEYYHHQDGWTNRLIQGDSHLVMASLLEREGMAGQVQTIYFDPPYGIKYGGNWQIKLNNRDVKDGNDEALTGEPEQIKAFRDTWELGIHSYLSYLRDRLLIAKELLTESGSCFVQIGDENVHLVRSVMDEVFGSENFCKLISFKKTAGQTDKLLADVCDYLIWYSKDKEKVKFRQLFVDRDKSSVNERYVYFEGSRIPKDDIENYLRYPIEKRYRITSLSSQTGSDSTRFEYVFQNKKFIPTGSRGWSTTKEGIDNLKKRNLLVIEGKSLNYKRFFNDFPIEQISNYWNDTGGGALVHEKSYVVQTASKVIQRCLLMTTDPGDLVLDPTCGSGTTAFVAEQWGRRWITIDTSRIALNIAKQRLMTAVFPYYKMYDEQGEDIRQGFVYKTVPHITLKSLANDEPPATETLYDQPEEDKKKLRVSGPFTVETLQNFEPISPEELDDSEQWSVASGQFEEVIKQHLLSAGIKNGRKDEMVVFRSVELLAGEALHAEGFYLTEKGEEKAYFHIGPKFGTVSKKLVSDAVKECRLKGDANWLIILGFSFESDIEGGTQTTSMGNFEVTKVRIHDDLLQEGLKKKPAKSAASFVTIGEPDISVVSSQWLVDSKNEKICTYEQFKELSGLNSLAEINGLGREHLSNNLELPEGGNIRVDKSNEAGSSEHTLKHSRGAIEELKRRVSSVFGNSSGLAVGTGNATNDKSTVKTNLLGTDADSDSTLSGSRQNVEWAEILAKINALTPADLPLTTSNWLQATIEGLDIYDPIKDIVKPRDVHDIAYWMVDDDYDGSNFVVKQVFFCGGDKDAFTKWRKGLDTLAKDSTKQKVEKTLKIEIDDEAFDRLYGHVSHPIELKKKGQKIAVRVISQFGEETTKVITV